MDSKTVWKAYKLCLKACKITCSSPYEFNIVSHKMHYKKLKGLRKFRIYLGSISLYLTILISCFNLSAPVFFGVYMLNSLTSVLANIIAAVLTGLICIPSMQLTRNPAETCGLVNHLAPITSTVAGKMILL